MATYSVYEGSTFESIGSTLELLDAATQSYTFTENQVVVDIPDNESRLIVPKNIRNAVLSLYDSIPFKENLVGNKYFIGIDSTNQNIKRKIYLGSRNIGQTEIVTSNILNANDVTIYNTKSASSNFRYKTSMAFITGTVSASSNPTIEAQTAIMANGTQRIDFTFRSPTGDISILSKMPATNDPGKHVIINGITYSRIQDNDPALGGSASDGRILTYQNGVMTWSDLTPIDPGWYGATDSIVPVSGSETYVNGYPLEFTDARKLPIEIGDLKLGETFDHKSISYMLDRIIYQYLPPTCTLELVELSMGYAEIGTSPFVQLYYTVSKKTTDTMPTSLTNMLPNQIEPIKGLARTISGFATGVVITPIEGTTTVFEITASDGQSFNSASASVTGVYPFFYGFTSSTTLNSGILKTLSKIVDTRSTQNIDIYESDVLSTDVFYFMYDYNHGPLSAIYDRGDSGSLTGYEVSLSRFNQTDAILSSPDGLWAQKRYRIYYSKPGFVQTYIGPNDVGAMFRFIFS